MFFVASKVLAWLLLPTTALLVLLAIALWCLRRQRYSAAKWTISAAFVSVVILFYSPLGPLLILPLERAIPPQPLPATIDGIIVLEARSTPD